MVNLVLWTSVHWGHLNLHRQKQRWGRDKAGKPNTQSPELQLSDAHVVPFSSFPELLRVYFLVPISSFSLIGPEMRPVRSYLTSHRQERTPREGEMTGKLSFLKCVFALYTRLCLGLIVLMELYEAQLGSGILT